MLCRQKKKKQWQKIMYNLSHEYLDCQYYQIPIIIYSDVNLSSTEKLLMSQLISLTFKNGYCFASNEYLANSMNVTKRTISKSLSNLKTQNYIIISYENQARKIYLNKEKVMTKTSIPMEEKFQSNIEKKFYHNKKELINHRLLLWNNLFLLNR